ncbi:MAG: DHHA1 domain-containing protein, partial [Dehalococcoidales bacterium]|nr:DHHA1 domain-containing protein [Dehalococcoidales bacterium]
RERARASHKFVVTSNVSIGLDAQASTEFVGHHCLEQEAKVARLLVEGKIVDSIEAGQEASIVLDTSPFYAEKGGQVGDTGHIAGSGSRFSVTDTVSVPPDITVHKGTMIEGTLKTGDSVTAAVEDDRRADIARNHTATHLLHAALREVLGEHIQQRGSLVAPEHLRFDFSHPGAMTPEEIQNIQRTVNEKIRENHPVTSQQTDYKKAVEAGAVALFDEKYGDIVRVMTIGEPSVSTELCGGTHVAGTGEIGYFHILSEGSIGAGLRRIEAVTGRAAEELIEKRLKSLKNIAELLQSDTDEVAEKVSHLKNELAQGEKQLTRLESEKALGEAGELLGRVETIKGVKVLSARVAAENQDTMRQMADYFKDKLQSAVIVLGAESGGRPVFIAAVTDDLVKRGYNAGNIVREVSKMTGGGGGGKPNFAQAGGRDASKIDEALQLVKGLVERGD